MTNKFCIAFRGHTWWLLYNTQCAWKCKSIFFYLLSEFGCRYLVLRLGVLKTKESCTLAVVFAHHHTYNGSYCIKQTPHCIHIKRDSLGHFSCQYLEFSTSLLPTYILFHGASLKIVVLKTLQLWKIINSAHQTNYKNALKLNLRQNLRAKI